MQNRFAMGVLRASGAWHPRRPVLNINFFYKKVPLKRFLYLEGHTSLPLSQGHLCDPFPIVLFVIGNYAGL